MSPDRPDIAITCGDPAGIGPEIVLKALRSEELSSRLKPVVIGSSEALKKAARTIEDGNSVLQKLDVIDIPLRADQIEFGKVLAECGRVSYEYLKVAAEMASRGRVKAIVTAPIHKESWKKGGVEHIGHTEALEALFGVKAETLFVVDKLKIFFLTRHVSLIEAIGLISSKRLLKLLHHANQALSLFEISDPKIAVAGLNPHAGDGGLFGSEESAILAPAIKQARSQGIDALGPLAADSVFYQCLKGEFDAVIALYHDQGHIAAKMHDFHGTVSVTTGLPVVRTSVDHGTAFDIAGKNLANPKSMLNAIKLAARLSQPSSKN
jgi:4-hydroxythreonine-4-phosphate dehydrogenase